MVSAKDFEEFVYILSHDLRASVRALAEVPEWIKEDLVLDGYKASDQVSEYFTLMHTHSSRLDRMLLDLLEYSRIGRKQVVQSVDLHAAMDRAISEVSPPESYKIAADFQCEHVQMGPNDVVTLLKIFLSNAIKHNDKPKGELTVTSIAKDGAHILQFEDNGPGIAAEHRARVLNVMTTLRPRDEVEGSGMGLAIAKKIVAFYGGQLIWMDREVGQGLALEIVFRDQSFVEG